MAGEKKILVLLHPESRQLSALHHALALAQRIKAQVIVLRIEPVEQKTPLAGWVDEAVLELLNRAREAGMNVSCNTLGDPSRAALVGFVQEQGIDVIVVGENGRRWVKDLLQMKSGMPSQIIRVSEKDEAVGSSRNKRS
jgi:nucleotide-binding universal stress UspA family protein